MLLSADVTPEAKRECLEAGADAFLAKPIEAARLLEELQILCGGKPQAAPEAGRAWKGRARRRARHRRGRRRWSTPDTLADLEELGSSPAFMDKLIGVFVADNVDAAWRKSSPRWRRATWPNSAATCTR